MPLERDAAVAEEPVVLGREHGAHQVLGQLVHQNRAPLEQVVAEVGGELRRLEHGARTLSAVEPQTRDAAAGERCLDHLAPAQPRRRGKGTDIDGDAALGLAVAAELEIAALELAVLQGGKLVERLGE